MNKSDLIWFCNASCIRVNVSAVAVAASVDIEDIFLGSNVSMSLKYWAKIAA